MAEQEHPEKRKLLDSGIQDDSLFDEGSAEKKQATDNNNVIFRGVPPVTIHMDCPSEKVGIVIGKKGVTINEIMKRSHCRIVIDQTTVPPRAMMTGLPQDLAVAITLVAQVIHDGSGVLALEEGDSANSNNRNTSSIASVGAGNDVFDLTGSEEKLNEDRSLLCPYLKIGDLLGTKGSIINEIMRRSGTKIRVIQETSPPGHPHEREVLIIGSPEQIADAKSLITRVLNEGHTALNEPGNTAGPTTSNATITSIPFGSGLTATLEEDVPTDRVGVVIGSKGSIVADITRRSNGCKVVINQDVPAGQPSKVVYTGTREQVELARVYVYACVSRGPNAFSAPGSVPMCQEISLVQSQTGKLLGPQGTYIKDIQYRSGTRMQVVMADESRGGKGASAINTLKITGNMDQVLTALNIMFQLFSTATGPAPSNYPVQGVSANSYSHSTPGYPASIPGSAPVGASVQHGGLPSASQYAHFGQQPATAGAAAGQAIAASRPVVAPISPAGGMEQGLGPDGTYGILSGLSVSSDGQHMQTADIRNEHIGKVIGKGGTNLALINTKSGAMLQLIKNTNSIGLSTKILITGQQRTVTLAGQMIQEILVNGPAGLLRFPDAKTTQPLASTPSGLSAYGLPAASSASPSADATSSFSKYIGAALSSGAGSAVGGLSYSSYNTSNAVDPLLGAYGASSTDSSFYQSAAPSSYGFLGQNPARF